MARAAESAHWYRRDGSPAYEVERADGRGLRPTTLRDARKLDLLPSVTTILSVLRRPELEIWKMEQAIHAALTLPRKVDEPEEWFIDRIIEGSREEVAAAAELGTAVHGAIAEWFGGRITFEEHKLYARYLAAVDRWMIQLRRDHGPADSLASEVSYAAQRFAGKIDFSVLWNDDEVWIVDFKTRKTKPRRAVPLYGGDALQLGGYSMLPPFSAVRPRVFNFILSTTEPDRNELVEYGLDAARAGFAMALDLWYLTHWEGVKPLRRLPIGGGAPPTEEATEEG